MVCDDCHLQILSGIFWWSWIPLQGKKEGEGCWVASSAGGTDCPDGWTLGQSPEAAGMLLPASVWQLIYLVCHDTIMLSYKLLDRLRTFSTSLRLWQHVHLWDNVVPDRWPCASVGSSKRAWASTQGKAGGKCILARGDFRSEEQLSIWSHATRPWQGKQVKHQRYHWSQLVRLECTMGWICVFSCLGIDVRSFCVHQDVLRCTTFSESSCASVTMT